MSGGLLERRVRPMYISVRCTRLFWQKGSSKPCNGLIHAGLRHWYPSLIWFFSGCFSSGEFDRLMQEAKQRFSWAGSLQESTVQARAQWHRSMHKWMPWPRPNLVMPGKVKCLQYIPAGSLQMVFHTIMKRQGKRNSQGLCWQTPAAFWNSIWSVSHSFTYGLRLDRNHLCILSFESIWLQSQLQSTPCYLFEHPSKHSLQLCVRHNVGGQNDFQVCHSYQRLAVVSCQKASPCFRRFRLPCLHQCHSLRPVWDGSSPPLSRASGPDSAMRSWAEQLNDSSRS